MITKTDALETLRPGVEWTMRDDDVAGIQWHTEGAQPLTESEVTAEMQRLETAAENAESDRVATIQAARDHAASIGFTDAMLAVMYPQIEESPSE